MCIELVTQQNSITLKRVMERPDNPSPLVYEVGERNSSDDEREGLTIGKVFNSIRDISDPEFPYTLEQLNVVRRDLIEVEAASNSRDSCIRVSYVPTVPHCSLAMLIGLAIMVKLKSVFLPHYPLPRLHVRVLPGTHNTDVAINRQLADKERVAAAMENPALMATVNACLLPPDQLMQEVEAQMAELVEQEDGGGD